MRSSSPPAALVALAVLALAPLAHAQEPTSPPAPAPAPSSVWMSVGATTFAAVYVASALVATTDYYTDAATGSKAADLWVPVFGPLDQIGKTHAGGLDVLLVLDALGELGGLSMFGYGVAQSMQHAPVAAPREPKVGWQLSPFAVPGLAGASVAATF